MLASIPPAADLAIPVPPNMRAIPTAAVVEAGGDPSAVAGWVEAHGGDLDRTLPVVATCSGVTAIPKPKGKRYYVVPEKELLQTDAA